MLFLGPQENTLSRASLLFSRLSLSQGIVCPPDYHTIEEAVIKQSDYFTNMKKCIFYGLSGEGLGHASRTLAVLDHLSEYEVHLFTYGKAYSYLKNKVKNLHRIQGIMFSYKNGAVDYRATADSILYFLSGGLQSNKNFIEDMIKIHRPDLFITDFEPSIARMANKAGVPLISVDNQHKFAYYDLIHTPLWMRMYGFLCGLAAKMLVPKPHKTVISTFHHKVLFPRKFNVTVTNGLIRKSLEDATPTKGDYTLVYLRDSISDIVLEAISQIPTNFRIYGAKDTPLKRCLEHNSFMKFMPLGSGFVDDLLACRAIISSAGNQLITEARHCKKPCLVVPEPKQYEQYINAFYVDRLGFGRWCDAKDLKDSVVREFLCDFQGRFEDARNGVYDVLKVIRETCGTPS